MIAEARKNLAHQFQVLGSVHRPAHLSVIFLVIYAQDLKPARGIVQIRQDVFAFVRLFGLFPGALQGLERAHLHIQPDRVSAFEGRRQAVASEIDPGAEEFFHGMVQHLRVEQRAVRRQAYDGIRFKCQRRLVETVEHVLQAAAGTGNVGLPAVRFNRIVFRLGGRGDHHLVDRSCPASALDHVRQHGLAGNIQQDLAWQAAGGHAALYDCNCISMSHELIALVAKS